MSFIRITKDLGVASAAVPTEVQLGEWLQGLHLCRQLH